MLTASLCLYPHYVCPASAPHSTSPAVGSESNGDPQAVRKNHIPSLGHLSLMMRKMFLSVTLPSLPLLIQPLPLLRVISKAVLKWPPAIYPNPSYMFGAVSSKPHLHSPKQRGCHCALTGSIDFLLEVGKFSLMTPYLKGLILLVSGCCIYLFIFFPFLSSLQ